MSNTYRNCKNLTGDMYMYSNNVSNVRNCFRNRNTSRRLNIYVQDKKPVNTLNLYLALLWILLLPIKNNFLPLMAKNSEHIQNK